MDIDELTKKMAGAQIDSRGKKITDEGVFDVVLRNVEKKSSAKLGGDFVAIDFQIVEGTHPDYPPGTSCGRTRMLFGKGLSASLAEITSCILSAVGVDPQGASEQNKQEAAVVLGAFLGSEASLAQLRSLGFTGSPKDLLVGRRARVQTTKGKTQEGGFDYVAHRWMPAPKATP